MQAQNKCMALTETACLAFRLFGAGGRRRRAGVNNLLTCGMCVIHLWMTSPLGHKYE